MKRAYSITICLILFGCGGTPPGSTYPTAASAVETGLRAMPRGTAPPTD